MLSLFLTVWDFSPSKVSGWRCICDRIQSTQNTIHEREQMTTPTRRPGIICLAKKPRLEHLSGRQRERHLTLRYDTWAWDGIFGRFFRSRARPWKKHGNSIRTAERTLCKWGYYVRFPPLYCMPYITWLAKTLQFKMRSLYKWQMYREVFVQWRSL